MKIYLIKIPPFGSQSIEFLTVGEWYDGDLAPIMYDPQTLQPTLASYVVKCNDGYLRKVGAEYFITLEEWREIKLNELGIK
jgi:hypothetical protein